LGKEPKMSEKYSVIFSGRVREGETVEGVKLRMAELFRVKPAQLEPFFRKAPAVLKRGLDETTAAKWVAAVEKAGALCWSEPDRREPAQVAPTPPPPVPRPPETKPPGERTVEPIAVITSPPLKPSDETVVPQPVTPVSTVGLAESIAEASRAVKNGEVVPFPKCPGCGRLPLSIEDPFMQTGICPQCGLIITKFADNFTGHQETLSDTKRPWFAFWQSPRWPSYWRTIGCLCLALFPLPALFRVFDLYGSDAELPTAVGLAVSGVILAGVCLVLALLSFYCFALFMNSRRIFLIHTAASLGLCAVFALVGAAGSIVSRAATTFVRMLGIGHLLHPVRLVELTAAVFLGIVLYLGFIRLPAEKHRWEYLDSPEYSAKVNQAMSLAGPEFPSGARVDKYRYYKYVYVTPTQQVDSDLEQVLNRLLPDFKPASFTGHHRPEVNLLVFNAISFREELARERAISPALRDKLNGLALEWARAAAGNNLLQALDSRSPVNGPLVQSIPTRHKAGE